MADHGITVQKFKVAENGDSALEIAKSLSKFHY